MLFEMNATYINANRRENCFPIKEINAKEGSNFKMREIEAINTKKHIFWSQLEQIYVMTELERPNKTELQLFEAISLQTMCVKFWKCWKAIVF